jgi:hypothetical protein
VGEEAIGNDREQDQATGDHRLDERDRSERERGDVEPPAD